MEANRHCGQSSKTKQTITARQNPMARIQDVKFGWQWRWKRGIMQRIILCKPNKIYVNITNSSDEWKRIDIAAKAAKQSRQSQQDGIP